MFVFFTQVRGSSGPWVLKSVGPQVRRSSSPWVLVLRSVGPQARSVGPRSKHFLTRPGPDFLTRILVLTRPGPEFLTRKFFDPARPGPARGLPVMVVVS